ncbi:hypothetical protein SVIO_080400 [Streptomyces violaceusniger]|uniref:FAD/NAD(P)-binding domain-containing protein n=1 Tax=Streptomyces violaceusniger TaxID=68280 RepID=A0A4D4LG14_STRVO|nr:hypothetical protein SVIO_080400 [Streptomyces violaceusniger]
MTPQDGSGGEERTLTARHAVALCTGTGAALPDMPGIAEARPWTSREATSAGTVPDRLIIVGGGVVAAEMATAWCGLGSRVTVLVRGSGLLARIEPFAGELVAETLREAGAEIRTGTAVKGLARPGGAEGPVTVTLESGEQLEADEVLFATGRAPHTADLGLETVGLEPGGWLTVDETCRVKDVPDGWLYAAGDINHRALLTHQGKYQARIAGAAIGARARGVERLDTGRWGEYATTADEAAVPQVVFTDPEVAAVGLTAEQAESEGRNIRVVDYDMGQVEGAVLFADGYRGRARMVVDLDRDHLIGVTFVGPGVSELLHSATVAVAGEVPSTASGTRCRHSPRSARSGSGCWRRTGGEGGVDGARRGVPAELERILGEPRAGHRVVSPWSLPVDNVGMSQQGDRRRHEDDWWGELYDPRRADAGPAAASDSVDDRFDSASRTLAGDEDAGNRRPAAGAPWGPRTGEPGGAAPGSDADAGAGPQGWRSPADEEPGATLPTQDRAGSGASPSAGGNAGSGAVPPSEGRGGSGTGPGRTGPGAAWGGGGAGAAQGGADPGDAPGRAEPSDTPGRTGPASAPGRTGSGSAPDSTSRGRAPGPTRPGSSPGPTSPAGAPGSASPADAPGSTNPASAPGPTNWESSPGPASRSDGPGPTNPADAPGPTNPAGERGSTNPGASEPTNPAGAPGPTSPGSGPGRTGPVGGSGRTGPVDAPGRTGPVGGPGRTGPVGAPGSVARAGHPGGAGCPGRPCRPRGRVGPGCRLRRRGRCGRIRRGPGGPRRPRTSGTSRPRTRPSRPRFPSPIRRISGTWSPTPCSRAPGTAR